MYNEYVKKSKKLFLSSGIIALLSTLAVGSFFICKYAGNSNAFINNGFNNTYADSVKEILLDSNNVPTSSSTYVDNEFTVKYSGSGYLNTASFTYSKVKYQSGKHAVFNTGGTFAKDLTNGLKLINIDTSTTGTVTVQSWFTSGDSPVTTTQEYDLGGAAISLCGNYFEVTFNQETIVDSIEICFECSVASSSHPLIYEEATEGDSGHIAGYTCTHCGAHFADPDGNSQITAWYNSEITSGNTIFVDKSTNTIDYSNADTYSSGYTFYDAASGGNAVTLDSTYATSKTTVGSSSTLYAESTSSVSSSSNDGVSPKYVINKLDTNSNSTREEVKVLTVTKVIKTDADFANYISDTTIQLGSEDPITNADKGYYVLGADVNYTKNVKRTDGLTYGGFAGTFDGYGHSINNIRFDNDGTICSLFGRRIFTAAVIKNFNINGVYFGTGTYKSIFAYMIESPTFTNINIDGVYIDFLQGSNKPCILGGAFDSNSPRYTNVNVRFDKNCPSDALYNVFSYTITSSKYSGAVCTNCSLECLPGTVSYFGNGAAKPDGLSVYQYLENSTNKAIYYETNLVRGGVANRLNYIEFGAISKTESTLSDYTLEFTNFNSLNLGDCVTAFIRDSNNNRSLVNIMKVTNVITTKAELNDFYIDNYNYERVSSGTAQGRSREGEYYVLGADISSCSLNFPSGYRRDDSTGFSGTFDGRNHTISGFTCWNYGLFSRINSLGCVKNTTISDINAFLFGYWYSGKCENVVLNFTTNKQPSYAATYLVSTFSKSTAKFNDVTINTNGRSEYSTGVYFSIFSGIYDGALPTFDNVNINNSSSDGVYLYKYSNQALSTPYTETYNETGITWKYKSDKINVANCDVTLSSSSYEYTGSAITPTITVKDGDTTLTANTDYTVSYTNNINVGTASITITGTGNYDGSQVVNFTIVRKDVTAPTIETDPSYTYNGSTIPSLSSSDLSSCPSGANVTYYYGSSSETIYSSTLLYSNLTTATLTPGTYYVYAKVGETTNTMGVNSSYRSFTVNKGVGSISFAKYSDSVSCSTSGYTNTLTNTGDGTVSYSSSDTSVATVDSSTGVVTLLKHSNDPVTISATVSDSSTYTYATKTISYTLTIVCSNPTLHNASDPINEGGSGNITYYTCPTYTGNRYSDSSCITEISQTDSTVYYCSGDLFYELDGSTFDWGEIKNENSGLTFKTESTYSYYSDIDCSQLIDLSTSTLESSGILYAKSSEGGYIYKLNYFVITKAIANATEWNENLDATEKNLSGYFVLTSDIESLTTSATGDHTNTTTINITVDGRNHTIGYLSKSSKHGGIFGTCGSHNDSNPSEYGLTIKDLTISNFVYNGSGLLGYKPANGNETSSHINHIILDNFKLTTSGNNDYGCLCYTSPIGSMSFSNCVFDYNNSSHVSLCNIAKTLQQISDSGCFVENNIFYINTEYDSTSYPNAIFKGNSTIERSGYVSNIANVTFKKLEMNSNNFTLSTPFTAEARDFDSNTFVRETVGGEIVNAAKCVTSNGYYKGVKILFNSSITNVASGTITFRVYLSTTLSTSTEHPLRAYRTDTPTVFYTDTTYLPTVPSIYYNTWCTISLDASKYAINGTLSGFVLCIVADCNNYPVTLYVDGVTVVTTTSA